MGDGLDEAAAFLLAMRSDGGRSSIGGVQSPAQVLQLDDFKKAAKGIHLTRWPLGPVPGANHTQSIQRRGDGSGQCDQ